MILYAFAERAGALAVHYPKRAVRRTVVDFAVDNIRSVVDGVAEQHYLARYRLGGFAAIVGTRSSPPFFLDDRQRRNRKFGLDRTDSYKSLVAARLARYNALFVQTGNEHAHAVFQLAYLGGLFRIARSLNFGRNALLKFFRYTARLEKRRFVRVLELGSDLVDKLFRNSRILVRLLAYCGARAVFQLGEL